MDRWRGTCQGRLHTRAWPQPPSPRTPCSVVRLSHSSRTPGGGGSPALESLLDRRDVSRVMCLTSTQSPPGISRCIRALRSPLGETRAGLPEDDSMWTEMPARTGAEACLTKHAGQRGGETFSRAPRKPAQVPRHQRAGQNALDSAELLAVELARKLIS